MLHQQGVFQDSGSCCPPGSLWTVFLFCEVSAVAESRDLVTSSNCLQDFSKGICSGEGLSPSLGCVQGTLEGVQLPLRLVGNELIPGDCVFLGYELCLKCSVNPPLGPSDALGPQTPNSESYVIFPRFEIPDISYSSDIYCWVLPPFFPQSYPLLFLLLYPPFDC